MIWLGVQRRYTMLLQVHQRVILLYCWHIMDQQVSEHSIERISLIVDST
jgi:hypothetical protein